MKKVTEQSKILRQWFFLLIFFVVALTVVGFYATKRYNYWENIESIVMEEGRTYSEYDRKDLEKILREFEDRKTKSEEIMSSLRDEVILDVSTSTDSELENIESEEVFEIE